MALPLDGRAINNILSSTLDAKLPEVYDLFFNTNALLLRLNQRARGGARTVRYRGGAEIRTPFIYAGMPAYGYGRGFTFGTGQKEFMTDLQFDWKRAAVEINKDHMDVRKNAGDEVQLIDYAETLAENASNSLFDRLGYQIYGTKPNTAGVAVANTTPTVDPDTGAPIFDGLYNGVLDTGVYGGITRGGSLGDPGFAIKANVNAAVAVPLSLSLLQQGFGAATFGNTTPDLGVTTQKLWNDLWNRVQPQDRNPPGPLRDVGFRTINMNGAEIIVDSHQLAGSFHWLNTEYIQLWLMDGVDFIRRGAEYGKEGFPIPNQDAFVDQLIVYGDLIVTGPRYQSVITGILE